MNQKPVQLLNAYQPSQSTYHNAPASNISTALSNLAAIGITGVKAEDLAKLLPHDSMEPALAIMAEVRAYFQG
jgi:hypothetical protein